MNKTRTIKEREHFDKLAQNNDSSWWGFKTPAAKLRFERRIKILKDFLSLDTLSSNKKILECGCSSGEFTKYLSSSLSNVIQITAVDISPAQLSIARKNINDSRVQFILGDVSCLEFNDSSFDFVIGNSILHHLDLNLALLEIKRVLKPSGKIIFFEPNMLNPQVFISLSNPFFRKMNQASPDETAFLSWEIRKTFLDAGFINLEVKPFDFLHPLTPPYLFGPVKHLENLLESAFLNVIAGSIVIKAKK